MTETERGADSAGVSPEPESAHKDTADGTVEIPGKYKIRLRRGLSSPQRLKPAPIEDEMDEEG